jgi:hypothetical protein
MPEKDGEIITGDNDVDARIEKCAASMRRPRVKPEHAPYRISDGRIRIGGVSYGLAAEVKDPTGSVWTLLESMDGTRDVYKIVDRVVRSHPGESSSSVCAGLRQFIDSGYVEDMAGPDPAELTARDKERYDRARDYYRWLDLMPRASTWEPQARLHSARVTVVGIGGTGGCSRARACGQRRGSPALRGS